MDARGPSPVDEFEQDEGAAANLVIARPHDGPHRPKRYRRVYAAHPTPMASIPNPG